MPPGDVSALSSAGAPSSPYIPAEAICLSGRCWRKSRSPIGERQIFRCKTTSIDLNIIAATIRCNEPFR